MSCRQFAAVLERELKAVGLSFAAPASCANVEAAVHSVSRGSPAGEAKPPRPQVADSAFFSPKAINLSFSLRQYAKDPGRPKRSDPAVVTGWNEAGYLRSTEQGLRGEMLFATASGTRISIFAESDGAGGPDIRVRAVKDGVAHYFSLDEFAECRREQRSAYVPVAGLLCPAPLPKMMPDEVSRQT